MLDAAPAPRIFVIGRERGEQFGIKHTPAVACVVSGERCARLRLQHHNNSTWSSDKPPNVYGLSLLECAGENETNKFPKEWVKLVCVWEKKRATTTQQTQHNKTSEQLINPCINTTQQSRTYIRKWHPVCSEQRDLSSGNTSVGVGL